MTTPSTPPPSQELAGVPAQDLARSRYGRRAPLPRRRVLVTLGVVLVLAVGWFLYIALRLNNPPLTWQDIGFRIVSAGSAEVTFDVAFAGRVDGASQAVCTLNAQNELHTDVGLKDVTVGPASTGRLRVTASLPTSERATTVLVKQCVLQTSP